MKHGTFQRVKKLLRRFLTRWETLKKECRFRRSVLVGVHRYGREQISGKQKILFKIRIIMRIFSL